MSDSSSPRTAPSSFAVHGVSLSRTCRRCGRFVGLAGLAARALAVVVEAGALTAGDFVLVAGTLAAGALATPALAAGALAGLTLAGFALAATGFAGLTLAGALPAVFALPFAGGLAAVALGAGDVFRVAGTLAVVALPAVLARAADDLGAPVLAGAAVVVFVLLFVAAFAAVASRGASFFADSPFRMAEVALFTAMIGPLKMALRLLQETRACGVRIRPSGAVLNGETPL
jgi:hypothetical protein